MASSDPSSTYLPVKLPHPFLTEYRVHAAGNGRQRCRVLKLHEQPENGRNPPKCLHDEALIWTDPAWPTKENTLPESDNSAYARAIRAANIELEWTGSRAPSLASLWNVIHAIFLAQPSHEYLRTALSGSQQDVLRKELLTTGLAIEHPPPTLPSHGVSSRELLILRASFWQGAASPVGPRPIWCHGLNTDAGLREPLDQYPGMPEIYKFTNKFPHEPVYTHHVTRRPKPAAGSIVYSRYIPELDEHLSLEVLDWENETHVQLFNVWQNDPRVAKGWNETGTLAEHRAYLRKLHFDPHTICVFGRFDDVRFSYHELYWSKEDHFGAHYEAHNYDRGRHSLVGDETLRGAKRVSAWYSSCIHYLFLDDSRTVNVVGEPRATGAISHAYDQTVGLTIGKYVDFGHKRSCLAICSREKWFQLCPLFWDGKERPMVTADRAAWNAKL